MRNRLLATTAAAALVAATAFAVAQTREGAPGAQPGGAQTQSPGTQSPGQQKGVQHEQKGAPEHKGAQQEPKGGAQQKGVEREQKGGPEHKGAQQERQQPPRQGTTGQTERPGTGQVQTQTERQGTKGGSVTLSSEQRTKIRETVIRSSSSARVDNVDFSISVGTRVPRTVHVVELPSTVIEIVPQYRGYKYFVVRDEILIVDPDTLEIVAIIPG